MNRKYLATLTTLALVGGSVALAVVPSQAAPAPAYTRKATPVHKADLPRHHDLLMDGRNAGFRTTKTYQGDGQYPISPCMQFGWKNSKPNTIWTRTYATREGDRAAASIASFKTHKQAVAAADAMGKALPGCGKRMIRSNPDLLVKHVEYNRTVTLRTGERARVNAVNMTDGETGNHFLVQTGVTVTGTHVELVTMQYGDMQAVYDTRDMVSTLNRTVKTLR
ncbi:MULTISPECIES: hypothetical protein [unclassified Luteococcus]|uniref:hypothetical protein n=1 Tax=unclassified Luteococcus TaxID=2639923 RepID=UPI00313C3382